MGGFFGFQAGHSEVFLGLITPPFESPLSSQAVLMLSAQENTPESTEESEQILVFPR